MPLRSKGKGKQGSKDDDGDERESLAFKVLTAEQTNELMGLDVEQIQDKLREIFNLSDYRIDLTQAATLDFYTSAVYWGIQQKFTAQQLSGFFTVNHMLFDNVKEKHLNLVDNSLAFNKLLAGIGVEDAKSSGLDFFNLQQAKLISQYTHTSFFQHYKLFLYMFTHTQAEEIIGTDLEVETAKAADVPFPPPLDEAITQDMYNDYILTPPPTPASEHSSRATKSANSAVTTPKPSSAQESKSRLNTPKSPKSRPTTGKSRGSANKSRGSSRESARKKVTLPAEEKPNLAKELEDQVTKSSMFEELTAQDVREVIESVAKDMLGSLQSDVFTRLKDKESQIIQRINKIHKVAE